MYSSLLASGHLLLKKLCHLMSARLIALRSEPHLNPFQGPVKVGLLKMFIIIHSSSRTLFFSDSLLLAS